MSARDKRAFESDLKNFMKAFNMTRGRALDAVANRVREDAQSILDTQGTSDTGVLKNTINVARNIDGSRRVETGSGYGLYVEFGRPAGRMPNPKDLQVWVRNKLGIKNQKRAKRVAFAIAKGIAQRGTKAQPFLRPAYERGIKRMIIQFRKEFVKQK